MRWFTFFLIPLLLSGCAGHYHQVEGETLHLYLKVPEAVHVDFASSLDGFKLHKAKRIGSEKWEVTAPAGMMFKYFYIVDGKIYVPTCRLKEYDGFGMENCIYEPQM
jgi:hypothetical protein